MRMADDVVQLGADGLVLLGEAVGHLGVQVERAERPLRCEERERERRADPALAGRRPERRVGSGRVLGVVDQDGPLLPPGVEAGPFAGLVLGGVDLGRCRGGEDRGGRGAVAVEQRHAGEGGTGERLGGDRGDPGQRVAQAGLRDHEARQGPERLGAWVCGHGVRLSVEEVALPSQGAPHLDRTPARAGTDRTSATDPDGETSGAPQRSGQAVEPLGVGAHDLALGLGAERGDALRDLADGVGVQARRVREVGLEHDVVLAD